MTKTINRDGEYIHLWWEDWPAEEYVRGHVPREEFLRVLSEQKLVEDEPPFPADVEVQHVYGRWAMSGVDDWGEPARTLRVYDEPGAGRFKISLAKFDQLYPPATCTACQKGIVGPRFQEDGATYHMRCLNDLRREREWNCQDNLRRVRDWESK